MAAGKKKKRIPGKNIEKEQKNRETLRNNACQPNKPTMTSTLLQVTHWFPLKNKSNAIVCLFVRGRNHF
jgi:hypothetical protein